MQDWFQTSLGHSILDLELSRSNSLVPSNYYGRGLQIGIPWRNYLHSIDVSSYTFICDSLDQAKYSQDQHRLAKISNPGSFAVADATALPFGRKTHDLIVLPHTLDFCSDPHEVLRQVNQILVPEGVVVIMGFNKLSLYGAAKLLKPHNKDMPWKGQFYRVGRVQDWLSLLGIDIVGAALLNYLPPIQSEKWRDKLSFLNKIGDRWFPGLAGLYILVGRKKQITMTPVRKRLKSWHSLIPGVAQPASQRAARLGIKIVSKNTCS